MSSISMTRTGKLRVLALGVGLAAVIVAGVEAFTHVPPMRTATAAPFSRSLPTLPKSAAIGPPRFQDKLDVSTFQKGNLHTHSAWSDGDRPPKDVYTWYRSHGYSFLALTDHDNRVSPETFAALEKPGFVIIAGEEITMYVDSVPVHVNGLCTKKTIGGGHFPTKRASLVHALENVHAQGGVALVNHPNFGWALKTDDVREAKGAELLEIWSGHPYVNTDGDKDRPSHEAIWDALLNEGNPVAGVAVDDAHTFGIPKKPSGASKPGKGWVQVFADKPDRNLICEGLAKGRLYTSSGATLTRVRVTDDAVSVWPKEEGAVVEFIGDGGKLLDKLDKFPNGDATYTLKGTEQKYVRARITLPDGKKAWTQAFRITR